VRLLEVSVPRVFTRRRPVDVAEAATRPPAPAMRRAEREDAMLLVELEDWADLLATDPTSARRVRARMRRMVAGATARYAGEVQREEGGLVASRFGWTRGAAHAAAQARAALSGEGGAPVRLVVHAAGRAAGVAGVAVLRDLARSGDVMLVDDVVARIEGRGDEGRPLPLGTFLLAGVPRPVRVALLDLPTGATSREAAVWGAPWAVRLVRRGTHRHD
jgi:hypothetical protein